MKETGFVKTIRIEVPPGTKVVLVAALLRSKLTKGEKARVKRGYPRGFKPPNYYARDQVEVTFGDKEEHPTIGTGSGLTRGY